MIATTKTSKDGQTLWVSVPISKALLSDEETKQWAAQRAGEMASGAVTSYCKQLAGN